MRKIFAIFTLVAGASLIAVGQDGSKSTDNQKKQTATSARSKTTRNAFGVNNVAPQIAVVSSMDQNVLREYAGVYQWQPNGFVYLQLWNELSGFDKPSQLVSFAESGEVRVLYPTERDHFFAGPGLLFQHRSSRESSFSAIAPAKSPR